jgi:hypothetical protein
MNAVVELRWLAGRIAPERGALGRAAGLCEPSLALARELGDELIITRDLAWLGRIAAARGQALQAEAWLEESRSLHARLGDRPGLGMVLGLWPRGRAIRRARPRCWGRAWSCGARWATGPASRAVCARPGLAVVAPDRTPRSADWREEAAHLAALESVIDKAEGY